MSKNLGYFKNAEIVFQWGALEYLRKLEGKKAAIITDMSSMGKLGFVERVSSYLRDSNIDSNVAASIEKEPYVDDFYVGAKALSELKPDLIIALGGGAVIDAAKGMWVLYEHPTIDQEKIFIPYAIPRLRNKARLVAIPSTSGTGSETSCAAVFVEPKENTKRLILSREIIPDLAILDPEIPMHMPPKVTASSGMDALSHALESYVYTLSNDFSEATALKAIKLIFENLERAYGNGKDEIAREKMHYAATLAGIAINNSGTGLAHAMDHIGPQFGIPHGVACSILLPYVMEFNLGSERARKRYAEIARFLGLDGKDEGELAKRLIEKVRRQQTILNLPASIKAAGVAEEKFFKVLELMVKHSSENFSARMNPRPPTPAEIRELYLKAYFG
ncbi:MAG: iron-containing alcohol dehydrogenase [Candidatus Hadarchaeum sp.]|uniref:iron-containing alcohol dehydrogenase n=1 Tax=Candidatus Hadarchaeum sp. TaxID=2883567 RepID=UPI003D0D61C9